MKLLTIYFFLKKINGCNYQTTYGEYSSPEKRNRDYTYLFKAKITGSFKNFQSEINREYNILVKKLRPWLGNKNPVFFYYNVLKKNFNDDLQQMPQINHTVILTFKDCCTDSEINEAFLQLTNLFKDLKGINSFSYGYSHLSEKTYIFEMEFIDQLARDNYLIDAKHVKVADFIIPLLQEGEASIIAFDYLLPKANEPDSKISPSKFFIGSKGVESQENQINSSSSLYKKI